MKLPFGRERESPHSDRFVNVVTAPFILAGAVALSYSAARSSIEVDRYRLDALERDNAALRAQDADLTGQLTSCKERLQDAALHHNDVEDALIARLGSFDHKLDDIDARVRDLGGGDEELEKTMCVSEP